MFWCVYFFGYIITTMFWEKCFDIWEYLLSEMPRTLLRMKVPFRRCFDPQEQLCIEKWFCILFSLYQWLQYLAFDVLFPYLSGLQNPKVFYICHSPALALVHARTICLYSISNFLHRNQCAQDRRWTNNMGGTFKFLLREPA